MTVNDCVSITEITLILVIEENGTRKLLVPSYVV